MPPFVKRMNVIVPAAFRAWLVVIDCTPVGAAVIMIPSTISGRIICWLVPTAEGFTIRRASLFQVFPPTMAESVLAHRHCEMSALPVPKNSLSVTVTDWGPSRR